MSYFELGNLFNLKPAQRYFSSEATSKTPLNSVSTSNMVQIHKYVQVVPDTARLLPDRS